MSLEANIIVYSAIAGLSTIMGIMLVMIKEEFFVRFSHYVNSFAAGLILSIAFFHLIPESLEHSDNALIFILAGFLLFYLLESVMVIHSGAEIHFKHKNNPHHSRGMVMFAGLFLHSLIDGVIIAIGFEIKPELGLLASIGVILHEFPEGITTFSILINTLKKKTALYMSIAVALATPMGAVVSLVFFDGLSEPFIGLLLALAGGSFLYIAASDLIPETHEEKGYVNAFFLFFGVFFLYTISILILH